MTSVGPQEVVSTASEATTYFAMAFTWSLNGSLAIAGHASAIPCQVTRPSSRASAPRVICRA